MPNKQHGSNYTKGLLPMKKWGRRRLFWKVEVNGYISGVHKLSELRTLQFSLFLQFEFS